MGSEFLTGLSLLLTLLGLALGLTGFSLFHLAKFLGEVLLAHQSLVVIARYLLTELLQLFTDLTGAFLLSLSLTDLSNGVLDFAISFC